MCLSLIRICLLCCCLLCLNLSLSLRLFLNQLSPLIRPITFHRCGRYSKLLRLFHSISSLVRFKRGLLRPASLPVWNFLAGASGRPNFFGDFSTVFTVFLVTSKASAAVGSSGTTTQFAFLDASIWHFLPCN